MQDDAYQIATTGWKAEINIIKNKKGKKLGWDCDLIPKSLVINKYFAKEQKAIDKLIEEKEKTAQQMETLKKRTLAKMTYYRK